MRLDCAFDGSSPYCSLVCDDNSTCCCAVVVVSMGFFIIVQVLLRGMTDSVRESINVRGTVVFSQSIPFTLYK